MFDLVKSTDAAQRESSLRIFCCLGRYLATLNQVSAPARVVGTVCARFCILAWMREHSGVTFPTSFSVHYFFYLHEALPYILGSASRVPARPFHAGTCTCNYIYTSLTLCANSHVNWLQGSFCTCTADVNQTPNSKRMLIHT